MTQFVTWKEVEGDELVDCFGEVVGLQVVKVDVYDFNVSLLLVHNWYSEYHRPVKKVYTAVLREQARFIHKLPGTNNEVKWYRVFGP